MMSGQMTMQSMTSLSTIAIFLLISFFIAMISWKGNQAEQVKKENEEHVKFNQQAHKEKMREVHSLSSKREKEFNYLREQEMRNEAHIQKLTILKLEKELAAKNESSEPVNTFDKRKKHK